MPGQVHHFIALENEQDRAYGLKRYMAETRRLYGVLDRRLDGARFRRRRSLGCRFRHPRLGLAPSAPQGRAIRLPQRQALVRGADGPPATKRGMEAKLD